MSIESFCAPDSDASIDWALAYADAGMAVHPVNRATKQTPSA